MRRRVLLAAVALLVVFLGGALLAPDVRWAVWGRLRGEAFYRGRPTSYWEASLRRWPSSTPSLLEDLAGRVHVRLPAVLCGDDGASAWMPLQKGDPAAA